MLELKNVCKSYQDFAVKNISFTLPRGYIMGFVGPKSREKYDNQNDYEFN